MCFANPSKSLEIARERMSAGEWAKFEREFEDFCITSGLPLPAKADARLSAFCSQVLDRNFNWAKWAYLSARGVKQSKEGA